MWESDSEDVSGTCLEEYPFPHRWAGEACVLLQGRTNRCFQSDLMLPTLAVVRSLLEVQHRQLDFPWRSKSPLSVPWLFSAQGTHRFSDP